MIRRYAGISAAAMLAVAVAACDSGSAQIGDKAAEQVAPKDVSKEALQAAVTDPRVRKFYEARQWQAAWNEDQARELAEALREAPRHGLTTADFLRDGDAAADAAQREATLTLAAISYADTLANGRVKPSEVAEIYTLPRPQTDVLGGLSKAVQEGNVGDWLNGLPPQDAEYKALSEAFLHYSSVARGEKRQPVPEGEALDPGKSDKRVPLIAAALKADGYLQESEQQSGAGQSSSQRYTPELVAAVKQLQEDHGLEADGVIGKGTVAALNGGAAERARTLAINLERRRWLERTPPETRIDVNTAAAFLTYLRDGQVRDMRRVVVGQPGWETPQLGSPIVRLVANPPWNVPESIEKDELAGKGAAYLARNNFTRKDGRLVQAGGPDSALGLVKFDMDNTHAIYLHDTPAKALFAADQRHASHGCVRVHDAIGFARMLADDAGKRADFDKGLASKEETFVNLPEKIPVRLLYHTAYVENGRVRFRSDAYGWDEDIAERLGMEKRARRAVATHIPVSGP
jgi:murein L,D-transpeptidase YcbB/YkuD